MRELYQWLVFISLVFLPLCSLAFEPMICTEVTTTYKNSEIHHRLKPDEIVMGRKHPSQRGWIEIKYNGQLLLADGRHLVRVEKMLANYAEKASKSKSSKQKEKFARKYNELIAQLQKLHYTAPERGRPVYDTWRRAEDPVGSLEKDLDYDRLKEVLKREQLSVVEADKRVEQLEKDLWKQEVKPEMQERILKLSRSKDVLIDYDPPVVDPYQDLEHDPNNPNPGYAKSFDTGRLKVIQSANSDTKLLHDWESILDGEWIWHHIDTRWKSPARFKGRWLLLEENGFKYPAQMDGDILVLRNPPLSNRLPGAIVFRMHFDQSRMTFSGIHLTGRFEGHSVVLTKTRK